MVAAYELQRAGYKVTILEYQNRAGGRNWSLAGGDSYTELGGARQDVTFAPGNYINPGPWRIPYHHHALLHYCREFGVALEPFVQVNHNAWLHTEEAFGGKPQRYRDIAVDFAGSSAELLAKAINQKALDQDVTAEDRDKLLTALRKVGVLDENYTYKAGETSSRSRGWSREPGGGPDGAPIPSQPFSRSDILHPVFWDTIAFHTRYEFQTTMFQPVGGMGQIGKAFGQKLQDIITFNARVGKIQQEDKGVVVTWSDTNKGGSQQTRADWCICALPAPILAELEVDVTPELKTAIASVPYSSSIKVGLEFNRRFWEEDEAIYGGISFTDQAIEQISYPSHGYQGRGPAVLLGAYMFDKPAYDFAGMSPAQRIELALEQGSKIHAQYRKEFRSGVAVAWSRVPWTLGCCSAWSEEMRKQHYKTLTTMDRRVVLAGEHASYVGCWQEGAVLSALSAITQMHQRASAA